MSGQTIGGMEQVCTRVLEVAHRQLGLDAAWFSEFSGGVNEIRATAGDAEAFGVTAGGTLEHAGSYCAKVARGALPQAIPDTRSDMRTRDLPVTRASGAGAYVGAPVRLPSGHVAGMICALSRESAPVGERDVQLLAVLAETLAAEIAGPAETALVERRDAVRRAIDAGEPTVVFQPIVDIARGQVAGMEALSRFTSGPRNPAERFAEAAMVGLGPDLELAAIRNALPALDHVAHTYLSLNVSPETILDRRLHELLGDVPGDRILLEVTEQAAIADYEPIVAGLRPLRARGIRVAVDDAGAGYASFSHILRLRPDVIKLDLGLTRDVDQDPVRQALTRALVEFARSIGASLVAEGVETQGELDMLAWLGVCSAQGYFLGRPGGLPLAPVTVAPVRREPAATSLVEPAGDERFVRDLLEQVVRMTGLESSYLTFQHGEQLEHRWVHNGADLEVPEPFTIPYEESLCHRARGAGLLWTAEVPTDVSGSPLADAAGIQTFLSIPVPGAGDGRAVTLCALSRQRRYVDAGTLAELEAIAAAIGARLGGA